jgi:uncharacterized protein
MMLALAVLGWSVFGLALLAGLGLNLVGLFGNWVILGALAAGWVATGFEHFSVWALVISGAFAVLGELLEFVAAGYGASKFGGSKGAMVASLVGCLVGAVAGTPWFPIVGTLAGACVGAFLAAALYEYLVMEKRPDLALWTGLGAALGKVAGMFAKVAAGFAMLCVAALTF